MKKILSLFTIAVVAVWAFAASGDAQAGGGGTSIVETDRGSNYVTVAISSDLHTSKPYRFQLGTLRNPEPGQYVVPLYVSDIDGAAHGQFHSTAGPKRYRLYNPVAGYQANKLTVVVRYAGTDTVIDHMTADFIFNFGETQPPTVEKKTGSNVVPVDACKDIADGIHITRFGWSYDLKNGVRDAGHGMRDYTLYCVSDTSYKVEWVEVEGMTDPGIGDDPVIDSPSATAPVIGPALVWSQDANAYQQFSAQTFRSLKHAGSYPGTLTSMDIPGTVSKLGIGFHQQAVGDSAKTMGVAWISNSTPGSLADKFNEEVTANLAGKVQQWQSYDGKPSLTMNLTDFYKGKEILYFVFARNNDGVSEVPNMPVEVDDVMAVYLHVGVSTVAPTPAPTPVPAPGVATCGDRRGFSGIFGLCAGDTFRHPSGANFTFLYGDNDGMAVQLGRAGVVKFLDVNETTETPSPSGKTKIVITYLGERAGKQMFRVRPVRLVYDTPVAPTPVPTPVPTPGDNDGLPDLVIEDTKITRIQVRSLRTGELLTRYRVTFTMQNESDTDVHGRIYYGYQYADGGRMVTRLASRTGLKANEQIIRSFLIGTPEDIVITADPHNKIAEGSESNNRAVAEFGGSDVAPVDPTPAPTPTPTPEPTPEVTKVEIFQKSGGSQIFEAGDKGINMGMMLITPTRDVTLERLTYTCNIPDGVEDVRLSVMTNGEVLGIEDPVTGHGQFTVTFDDPYRILAGQAVLLTVTGDVPADHTATYTASCGVLSVDDIVFEDMDGDTVSRDNVSGNFGFQTEPGPFYIIKKVS